MKRTTWVAGAVAMALAVGSASQASAYVPYRTSGGNLRFHWPIRCVPLRVYVDDFPTLPPEQIMAAAAGAAAAWSAASNPCSSINIVVQRAAGPGPTSQYDYVNTITFRSTGWQFAPTAPAGTNIYASRTTGEIRDADIEVNVATFEWGILDVGGDGGSSTKMDLQNVLTSQLGHLLGFDSVCASPQTSNPALDDMDNPVPGCEGASQAVREATMYPSALPGETSKRTLEADDQRAVCETYPRRAGADAAAPFYAGCERESIQARDGGVDGAARPDAAPPTGGDAAQPMLSPSSDGCGCALGGGAGRPWALFLAAAWLLRARRRAD